MSDTILEQQLSIDEKHSTLGNPMQSTLMLFKKQLTNSCLTLRDPTQFLIEVQKAQFIISSQAQSLIQDLYLLDLRHMGSKLSLISRLTSEVVEQCMSKSKYFFEEVRVLQERRLSVNKQKFCSHCRKGLLLAELQKGNASIIHGVIDKKDDESDNSFSASDIEIDSEELEQNRKIVMGIEPSDAARKLTEILNSVIDEAEEFYIDDKQWHKIGEFQQKFEEIKNKVKTNLAYTLERTFVTIRQKKDKNGERIYRKQVINQGVQTTNWQFQEDIKNLQIKRDALSKALNWERELKEDITDKLRDCVKSLQSARSAVISLQEKVSSAKEDIDSKKEIIHEKECKIRILQKNLEMKIQEKEVADRRIYELKQEIFHCENKINCLNEVIEIKDSIKDTEEVGVQMRSTIQTMNKGLQVDLIRGQFKEVRGIINTKPVSPTLIKENRVKIFKQKVQIVQKEEKEQIKQREKRVSVEEEDEVIQRKVGEKLMTGSKSNDKGPSLKKYPSKMYKTTKQVETSSSGGQANHTLVSSMRQATKSFKSFGERKSIQFIQQNINLNDISQIDYSKVLQSSKMIEQTARSIKGKTYSKRIPIASPPSMSFVGPIITTISNNSFSDYPLLNTGKKEKSEKAISRYFNYNKENKEIKPKQEDPDISIHPSQQDLYHQPIHFIGSKTPKQGFRNNRVNEQNDRVQQSLNNSSEKNVVLNRNTFCGTANRQVLSPNPNSNARNTVNVHNKSSHQTLRASFPFWVDQVSEKNLFPRANLKPFAKPTTAVAQCNTSPEPHENTLPLPKHSSPLQKQNKLKLNIKSLSKYMKKSNRVWISQLKAILVDLKSPNQTEGNKDILTAVSIYDKVKVLERNNYDKYCYLKSQLTDKFYKPSKNTKENAVLLSIIELINQHKQGCKEANCFHLKTLSMFLDNVDTKVKQE